MTLVGFVTIIIVWASLIGVIKVYIGFVDNMNDGVYSPTDVIIVGALSSARVAVNYLFGAIIISQIPFIGNFLAFFLVLGMIYFIIPAFPLLFGGLITGIIGATGHRLLYKLPVFILNNWNRLSPLYLNDLIDYVEGNREEIYDIYFTKNDVEFNQDFVERVIREERMAQYRENRGRK